MAWPAPVRIGDSNLGVWKLEQGRVAPEWRLVSRVPDTLLDRLRQPVQQRRDDRPAAGPVNLFFHCHGVHVAAGIIFVFILGVNPTPKTPRSWARSLVNSLGLPGRQSKCIHGVPVDGTLCWSVVGFHLLTGVWQVYLHNFPGWPSINCPDIMLVDIGGNHCLL